MTQTPVRNKLLLEAKSISIPPSPQMQQLGYGTGVNVYKLERSENRSPWVLKKIARKYNRAGEMAVRLHFEASILRTLNHPNIVGFRALLQETDGRKCIAMEDCTISLGDLIEQRVDEGSCTPFPSEKIQKVMEDIAEGLQYLHHEAFVLHCDIKSYNILVKNNFEVCKLCDFGVSLPLKSDGTIDYSKTAEIVDYVGTDSWCPPEIQQAEQIITVKADIWAYGLCLWEMISLEPPYLDEANELSKDETLEESIINLVSDDESVVCDDGDKSIEVTVRHRPKVPCEGLDDSYLAILQVYYLCTEQEYQKRPNAQDLCFVIEGLNST